MKEKIKVGMAALICWALAGVCIYLYAINF